MKVIKVTEVRDVETDEIIHRGTPEEIAEILGIGLETVKSYQWGRCTRGNTYFCVGTMVVYDAWERDFIERWKEMQRSFGINTEVAAG